jgi:hypothetical protein
LERAGSAALFFLVSTDFVTPHSTLAAMMA